MTERVVMIVTNPVVSDPRVEKEAVTLTNAGYAVTIIGWDRAGEAPQVEERAGVRIERLGPTGIYGGGMRSLPLFREFWKRAVKRSLEIDPAAVHCHDLDTAPVGLSVCKHSDRAVCLVLDLHECYSRTRMVPQRGFVGIIARGAVGALECRACRAADVIFVASPGIFDHYLRMSSDDKLVVIENAPEAARFVPRELFRPSGLFTVGYIGQKRYVESLTMLMDIVQRHSDMAAFLAGGGTAAKQIDHIGAVMERVITRGAYTYAEQPALYDRCDAVYGVYDAKVGNIRGAFPVKVMEGMACALPVVVNAGTWIGRYVEDNGVGLAVDGDDSASVEAALVYLKDNPELASEMGARGRRLVEAGLSWEVVSKRMLAAYARLCDI